jgi:hypothetical protein
MKMIHVISDGSPFNTKVLALNGNPIEGIIAVDAHIDSSEPFALIGLKAYAKLDLTGAESDFVFEPSKAVANCHMLDWKV